MTLSGSVSGSISLAAISSQLTSRTSSDTQCQNRFQTLYKSFSWFLIGVREICNACRRKHKIRSGLLSWEILLIVGMIIYNPSRCRAPHQPSKAMNQVANPLTHYTVWVSSWTLFNIFLFPGSTESLFLQLGEGCNTSLLFISTISLSNT